MSKYILYDTKETDNGYRIKIWPMYKPYKMCVLIEIFKDGILIKELVVNKKDFNKTFAERKKL